MHDNDSPLSRRHGKTTWLGRMQGDSSPSMPTTSSTFSGCSQELKQCWIVTAASLEDQIMGEPADTGLDD